LLEALVISSSCKQPSGAFDLVCAPYAHRLASVPRARIVSGSDESSTRRPPFDYTAVGHVTVDVLDDGSRRPGGGAFYSALQAARLGLRTLILTRGVPAELQTLLHDYLPEVSLEVLPAAATTTLATSGEGAARAQRVLAWAGPIGAREGIDTDILHLAPVVRETSPDWSGRASFVGVTAQGLVREWAHEGALISVRELDARELPARCDAIVIAEEERESAAAIEHRRDAVVAITGSGSATLLQLPGRAPLQIPVPPVATVRDDLGAGDVFAAALFIALSRREPPERAVAFAHAAAAVRIAGLGAGAIGDARAIRARLAEA
jgi:sugar/nucleoside kinase (ribokinase family)